jgi:cobalt/nickel transport system ATP-binding protein
MSEQKAPLVEVTNLTYKYHNGKEALKQISVTFHEGEKIAVIGNNGAGKSTFFLNLNGVLAPTEGEIRYRGELLHKKTLKSLRKNIAIVFQNADEQMIASTVKAEISFGPMNLKLPIEEVEKRVAEAMDYMNLSEYGDRPPHYLSGGEKKRVSIADIIAMEPELIIFDEPTAALDPFNADMLEDVLMRLSAEGKTLLVSTHDMDFAYRFADRVLVFCNGELIADDKPEVIFANDALLAQASLKKPTLMELWQMFMGEMTDMTGIKEEPVPKNIKQWRDAIQKLITVRHG